MSSSRIYQIALTVAVVVAVHICLSCKVHTASGGATSIGSTASAEDSIAAALDYQLANYPASQYRDIYKNFMQDFFGPGHILADTAASGRYLRYELSTDGPFEGPLYEKTGYKGNFYRVNLSLLRDGVIPYDLFFSNFVESVQGIVPPATDEWVGIWNTIDGVIRKKGLSFPGENDDRRELREKFDKGDYVMHHSRRYNDSVHFHYRIISRDLFETNLLPLITASSDTTSDGK